MDARRSYDIGFDCHKALISSYQMAVRRYRISTVILLTKSKYLKKEACVDRARGSNSILR